MNKAFNLAQQLLDNDDPFIYQVASCFNAAIDEVRNTHWFKGQLADLIYMNGNRLS